MYTNNNAYKCTVKDNNNKNSYEWTLYSGITVYTNNNTYKYTVYSEITVYTNHNNT